MSNEQRAAEVLAENRRRAERVVSRTVARPWREQRDAIARALDEAEARGRAEVLARDEAWKTKVGSALQDYDRAPVDDVYAAHRLVRVLRALVADLSPAGTGRADTTGAER